MSTNCFLFSALSPSIY